MRGLLEEALEAWSWSEPCEDVGKDRLPDSRDHEEGLSGVESEGKGGRTGCRAAFGSHSGSWDGGMCPHSKESTFICKLFHKDFREGL